MYKVKKINSKDYEGLEDLKQLIAREAVINGLCDVGSIDDKMVVELTSNSFYHFTMVAAKSSLTLTVVIGKDNLVSTRFARLSAGDKFLENPWSFGNMGEFYGNGYGHKNMEAICNHLTNISKNIT